MWVHGERPARQVATSFPAGRLSGPSRQASSGPPELPASSAARQAAAAASAPRPLQGGARGARAQQFPRRGEAGRRGEATGHGGQAMGSVPYCAHSALSERVVVRLANAYHASPRPAGIARAVCESRQFESGRCHTGGAGTTVSRRAGTADGPGAQWPRGTSASSGVRVPGPPTRR